MNQIKAGVPPERKPHVITITGDLIHDRHGLAMADDFLNQLTQWAGKTPIVACLGNHDYYTDDSNNNPNPVLALYKQHHIPVLNHHGDV
jgi:predicted MPP superfamily phosphohydrolase